MSFRDNVEAILMGDGDITEMTNALMTELNRARGGAWDEGRESFATDLLRPLSDIGTRESSANPYRITK